MSKQDWPTHLRRMGQAIGHRGPDDFGIWTDAEAGLGLVHRRLSIVDLSAAGHQPMQSASGRYVIVFNGEIYNHLALRSQLERAGLAPAWRGHSDTETMQAGFDAWGVAPTLKACVGMFAFALWDKAEHALYLGRDRLGEKPLYYGWQNGCLLFGSELKALRAHPAFIGDIDRDALALQMRHNYIPAPRSIYRDIRKLPPGTLVRIAPGATSANPEPYWSLQEVAERGLSAPFSGSLAEAAEMVESQLKESIALQMVAEVPLGAFLSGGIDSSLVVALMQAQSTRPVKTFTIGFQEQEYNEAPHAHKVARHLGTEHTELYVSARQALDIIPRLPLIYDEPFSDSSQIPTFLVSQMTRQHVTVSLSGDGGDELFGGYGRYIKARGLWNRMGWAPGPARRLTGSIIRAIPRQSWDSLARLLPHRFSNRPLGDRLYLLADVLACEQPDILYQLLISHWKDPSDLVLATSGDFAPEQVLASLSDKAAFEDRMLFHDTTHYLPDDILVKVDRAAMAVSLETRVPMLDHRLVETAWTIPWSLNRQDGQGKAVLREVLYKYVPRTLLERPKMGFGVPIDSWLRGPLRDWAEELLGAARLRREGFFQAEPIRQKWTEHLSGQRDWHYYLWDVLMFQAWLQAQSGDSCT